jgi:hypothetical protein
MPNILILISISITPQFARSHIIQVYFLKKLGKNNEGLKNLRGKNIEIEIRHYFPEIIS